MEKFSTILDLFLFRNKNKIIAGKEMIFLLFVFWWGGNASNYDWQILAFIYETKCHLERRNKIKALKSEKKEMIFIVLSTLWCFYCSCDNLFPKEKKTNEQLEI